jgi:uncharacterized protein
MAFSFSIDAYAAGTLSGEYANVDTSEKVYDYADLLTDEEEAKLKDKIDALIKKSGYDVFIVLIDENPLYSAQSFINDFGDYNGFGLGENKSYVALLIDMDNRRVEIDTVGDCVNKFDTKIEKMLDKIQPKLTKDNYYSACDAFLQKTKEYGTFTGKLPGALLKGILIGMGISVITTVIMALQSKTIRKATEASKYTSQPLKLTKSNDTYVRTYETKVAKSNGSGSGSHTSSSGRSHGGGGRSF